MQKDMFKKRKEDTLSKDDKSHIGDWDERIWKICRILNKKANYYSTSSCSGRIVVMVDQQKKAKGLFLLVYHDEIKFRQFKRDLQELSVKVNGLVKYKQEPFILHVACADMRSAQDIVDKARFVGFKKSGIISTGKRYIVEVNGSEKLEFPIIKDKNLLVGDAFLKEIIKKSNYNLKKNWKKIKDFENLLK